jgi:hypothetical protein
MSRGKLALIVATELLLPVILAISLVFVIRSQPSKMPAASPLAQSLSPTLAGGEATDLPYPPSKQPIPVVVETPLPIPELIVLGATENPTPAYNPYPISNPNPTFTPYPTPTLRSGPAPTLIPLIEPAKDAAGTIVYISQKVEQAAESEKELITISVDAAGMLIGRPSRLPIIPFPSGYFYPSPDGSHMVIISDMGEADVYSILDVNSGKVDPLIGGKSLEAFFGWYPDNQHVLVGPSRGLALWNIFNIKEYVLLAMPGYGDIGGAAASPDGQKVVYYSSNDFSSSAGVWMVNVDGREATFCPSPRL